MSQKPKFSFKSKNLDSYTIEMPKPMEKNSFFVFSLVKAGSTLINGIVRDICEYNNVPVVSIFDDAFRQGIATNDIQSDIDQVLLTKGYAYLGFRHFFNFNPTLDLSPLRKILLVRDPKDILTSLYFSVKHSHVIPKSGRSRDMMIKRKNAANSLNIDDFVLKNAQSIINSYQSYVDHLDLDNWIIYKYEDIIDKKEEWIHRIATDLDLQVSKSQLSHLLKKYDIFPQYEKVNEHIRQVTPGNYLNHLRSDTIHKLNERFSEIGNHFGYL